MALAPLRSREIGGHEVAVDWEALRKVVDDTQAAVGRTIEGQLGRWIPEALKQVGAMRTVDSLGGLKLSKDDGFVEELAAALVAGMQAAADHARSEAVRLNVPLANLTAGQGIARMRAKAYELIARGHVETTTQAAVLTLTQNAVTPRVVDDASTYLRGLKWQWLSDQAAGLSMAAVNWGRVVTLAGAPRSDILAAVDTAFPDIEEWVASEIMDSRTCSPCEVVDGTLYPSLEDALADYPTGGYKGCLGGVRCRGTVVRLEGLEPFPDLEAPPLVRDPAGNLIGDPNGPTMGKSMSDAKLQAAIDARKAKIAAGEKGWDNELQMLLNEQARRGGVVVPPEKITPELVRDPDLAELSDTTLQIKRDYWSAERKLWMQDRSDFTLDQIDGNLRKLDAELAVRAAERAKAAQPELKLVEEVKPRDPELAKLSNEQLQTNLEYWQEEHEEFLKDVNLSFHTLDEIQQNLAKLRAEIEFRASEGLPEGVVGLLPREARMAQLTDKDLGAKIAEWERQLAKGDPLADNLLKRYRNELAYRQQARAKFGSKYLSDQQVKDMSDEDFQLFVRDVLDNDVADTARAGSYIRTRAGHDPLASWDEYATAQANVKTINDELWAKFPEGPYSRAAQDPAGKAAYQEVEARSNEARKIRDALKSQVGADGLRYDTALYEQLQAVRPGFGQGKVKVDLSGLKPAIAKGEMRWGEMADWEQSQQSISEFVPKEWANRSGLKPSVYGDTERAFARGTTEIHMDSLDDDIFLHEWLHTLQAKEDRTHPINRLLFDFHKQRTLGDVPKRVRDLFPGSNYRDDEVTLEDKFTHAYMGKTYGSHGPLEMLTMGMNGVVDGSLAEDKEMMDLLIGLLAKG